ncbi:MAG: response regulator [Saprospiraceae bacterium]|nr:response regulator [Saprospiraceae bacterium]
MNKLWIIDDDEIFTYLVKSKLKNAKGFDFVENFFCPEHALEVLELSVTEGRELPSVIFLDINMPKISGWEFLEKMKKLNISFEHTKVFIISSSSSYSDQKKVEEYPKVDYISKPLTNENIEIVRKYY